MIKGQLDSKIHNNQIENMVIFPEMQRAEKTKTNDAVILRQFHCFLSNAKLPSRWRGSANVLHDALKMPVIIKKNFLLIAYLL